MPESRGRQRKKPAYHPAPTPAAVAAVRRRKRQSPAWYGGLIAAFFLIGIAWLVIYYTSAGSVPGLRSIGGANILIGFGFICVGFGLATQWR